MSLILEQERSLLEELETIEDEVTKRIQRNPAIYKPTTRSSTNLKINNSKGVSSSNNGVGVEVVDGLNVGLTFIQQHEIKLFLNKYQELAKNLKMLMTMASPNNELSQLERKIGSGDDNDFKELYSMTVSGVHNSHGVGKVDSNSYAMFSSDATTRGHNDDDDDSGDRGVGKGRKPGNKRKKRRILSSFAGGLHIKDIFNMSESYGKFLNLSEFYKKWLSLPRETESSEKTDKMFSNVGQVPTYLSYLNLLNQGMDDCHQDIIRYTNVENTSYLNYLVELFEYLSNYYIKIQPLQQPELEINSIVNEFDILKHYSTIKLKQTVNEEEELTTAIEFIFCKVCNHKFTNKSSFENHITGKKHKRKLTANSSNTTALFNIIKYEHLVTLIFSKLLSKQLVNTMNETQRFNLLTNRERQIELRDQRTLSDDELAYMDEQPSSTANNNMAHNNGSSSTKNSNDNPLNLPLGPDNKPIPYWLWKLKGLDNEFNCEICGNFKYKGKINYLKHFKDMKGKHYKGLMMLGVLNNGEDVEVYNGLGKINDVLKLSEALKGGGRNGVSVGVGIEVEDEEGNVMTEEVYQQLKKQGLL